MRTLPLKDAKYGFGRLIDLALRQRLLPAVMTP
jgi:hypothetical protein